MGNGEQGTETRSQTLPELPEVETARRIIECELSGQTVESIANRLPKLMRQSPIPTLDPLIGRTLRGARRRAKVLVIDFSGDLSLMIHLKLAGQVSVHHPGGPRHTAGHPVPDPHGPYPHKTTHVEFHFTNGSILYLSDVRQFGWLRLMPTADVDDALAAFDFGPEAVGAHVISASDLHTRLARRTIPIKLALLDQTVLAGLGNIYVDEALHRAKIHPITSANTIPLADLERLAEGIVWALEMGIEQGGAKIIHNKAYPVDGFPEVHARGGLPCPVCGTTIVKMRVGSRGTYFCPTCQPEPVSAEKTREPNDIPLGVATA